MLQVDFRSVFGNLLHFIMSSGLVAKSYEGGADALIHYIAKLSTRLHPLQEELQKETLGRAQMAQMLGAPEVLEFGKAIIHMTQAKKALDIGTFTGASALAWSLALPDDGKVISMDVDHSNLNTIGKAIISKDAKIEAKIDFRLGSALDTLDGLIAAGQSGTFDFCFIDADKGNYTNYFERSMTLLRAGGVILVDNALWDGRVVSPKTDSDHAIDDMNKHVAKDERVFNTLLNIGDGLHFIVKKF